MKTANRLLAFLVAACTLAALIGCSLRPSSSGGGGKPAAKGTTAVVTAPASEEDFDELNALFSDLFRTLTRAQTTVEYDDPAVGTTLTATSNLTRDGETLTYRATVDRVNPADADRFLTSETQTPVTGTVEEIRANCSDLIVWDRVATGLVLSTPAFSSENLTSPVIEERKNEKTLLASVPDAKLESFFGFAPTGVTGMRITVIYTASAVSSLWLAYTAGDATVSVTVTYTY